GVPGQEGRVAPALARSLLREAQRAPWSRHGVRSGGRIKPFICPDDDNCTTTPSGGRGSSIGLLMIVSPDAQDRIAKQYQQVSVALRAAGRSADQDNSDTGSSTRLACSR